MTDQQAFGIRTEFVLIVFALALLIPARLIFSPLGAAGRVAVLLGLGMLLLWLLAVATSGAISKGFQPVRWIVGAFLLTQSIGYLAGQWRGLVPMEGRSADRALITIVALTGVALLTMDLIKNFTWLRRVVAAIVTLGALQAVMGLLQFYLEVDINSYISIPGLSVNGGELLGASQRGTGVNRVIGTMNHYIEFGVVNALIVPLAFHTALFAKSVWGRRAAWLAAGLILLAIPMSVSRSGLVTLLVAIGGLAVVWPWRMKIRLLVAGAAGLVVYPIVSPGVLGTLRALFLRADDDPSVQGRTEDYEILFPYVWERPIIGRGLGTFMPERYILLDNQYLYTLVTTGFLGLAGFLALFLGAYAVGRSIRRRSADDEYRHLGQSLAAAVLAAGVASSLFDSLSFSTFSAMVFLLIGLTGALWRLSGIRPGQPASTDYTTEDRTAPPLFPDFGQGKPWHRPPPRVPQQTQPEPARDEAPAPPPAGASLRSSETNRHPHFPKGAISIARHRTGQNRGEAWGMSKTCSGPPVGAGLTGSGRLFASSEEVTGGSSAS